MGACPVPAYASPGDLLFLPTSFPSLALTVPLLVCACPPGPFLFPPGPLPFQSLAIFLLPVILCTCGLLFGLAFFFFFFALFLTPFVSPISLLTLAMSPACPLVCLPPLAGPSLGSFCPLGCYASTFIWLCLSVRACGAQACLLPCLTQAILSLFLLVSHS